MRKLPFRSLRWRFAFWFGLYIIAIAISIRYMHYRLAVDLLERDIDDQLWARLGSLKVQQRFAPETVLDPNLSLGGLFLPDIRAASDWKPSRSLRLIMPALCHSGPEAAGFSWFAGVWQRDGTAVDEVGLPPGLSWDPQWTTRLDTIWTGGDGRLRLAATGGEGDTVLLVGTPLDTLSNAEREVIFFHVWSMVWAVPIGLSLAWLVLSQMLKPLAGIARTAERIGAGHFEERIDVAAADSEIVGMATMINGMLDRLDALRLAQSRFNADLAHQVLNPVHGMLLQTDVALQRPRSNEELAQTIDRVHGLAARIRTLCEAMLTYSRTLAIEPAGLKPIDLEPVVEAAVEQVMPVAAERGITIEVASPSAIVRGQAELLMQVFINLLANAVEHSPDHGRVAITIGLREGHWEVVVVDHGCGVPAAAEPHLFERFFQGAKPEGRPRTSHGIGLAICKNIMTSHGGDVSYQPTPGGGATFTARFPPA
jgi:signal transduction histidine kinase